MKPRLSLALLAFAVMLSCSDKGTEPEPVASVAWQTPGCVGHGLAKIPGVDTCFVYTFGENLDVLWCLPANCCPDSQRFVFSIDVRHDTITVTVIDTAAHLCRCICSYNVRAQIVHVPLDRYVFLVRYDDSLYYDEIVERKR